jgi:hypothetical protein
MSQKTFKSTENKRAVDLGKVTTGLTTDLIKVWRTTTGEEKAISLGDINGGLIGDYVPYTGAVDDVDLGEKGISTGYVKYDTTPTSTPTDQGTSYWDIDDNTLAIIMNGTTLKVGEDQYYPVKNQTGVLIPKGTAVRFAGTLGSSGRLLIAPFLADGSVPSSRFMGVTSEDIDNGADGKVMWFGRIRGLNTNAFNEGDVLYASTTAAGGFQTTIPVAPNNIVQVCAVINKSTTQGIIFVRPTLGSNINKDEGVKFTSPTTGDLLQLQSSGLWENKSTTSIILSQPLTGYTVGANTALAATDTILQAFGKAQGQINARISGTAATGRISFGGGTNTITSDPVLVYDSINKRMQINTTDVGATLSVGTSFNISDGTIINRLVVGAGSVFIGSITNHSTIIRSNGVNRIVIQASGEVGIGNITPTNTLDVNGTARIRTISNLGSAATSVLVPSATGVVSSRTLAELASDLGAVTITGTQTITGVKTFNADVNIGDPALNHVGWSNSIGLLGIFSQTQFLHKYRGGAAGALNIGQYDVNGNASINNTSNGLLALRTNDVTRVEIEADGDVLLKKVDNGTGDIVTIDATTGQLRKRTASQLAGDIGAVSLNGTNLTSISIVDIGGGATYSYSFVVAFRQDFVNYYKYFFSFSGISTSGTPTGDLEIQFSSVPSIGSISQGHIGRITGSNMSNLGTRIPILGFGTIRFGLIDAPTSFASAVTFTSGTLRLEITA